MVDFTLYLITDRHQTAGRKLPAVVAEALKGGVKSVQLREKDLPSRQLFQLAGELRELTSEYGAQLLINDRIDMALAVNADGVHLGVSSIPVPSARKLLKPGCLIGYSAHSVNEALQAESDGADFVTFGPVFPTPSKLCYGPPLGLEPLAHAARALTIPVFALGGINMSTAAQVMSVGCRGVALISALLTAESPRCEASDMLNLLGVS